MPQIKRQPRLVQRWRNNSKFIFLGLFFLLFILQLSNAVKYDFQRGFDAGAHLSYINYLRINHKLPLPHEDFGFYHPPLYYVLASFFGNPFFLKILGFLVWLGIAGLTFYLLQNLLKDFFFSCYGTILLVSTPVLLYMIPNITNEVLFAFFCLLFFYSYLVKKNYLLSGVVMGLMFLTKSTAVTILVSFFINELILYRKNKSFWKNILLVVFPVIVISGWFYMRNYLLYKKIFFINLDLPQLTSQMPKESRGLDFIFNLKPFFELDIFQAQHKSLIAGTYFSWFYDGHNNLIPVQAFSKIGTAVLVLSLPVFIFSVVGFFKSMKKSRLIFFNIYSLIFIVSYLIFNLRYPYYSSVKGSYLMGLLFPSVYFFIKGMGHVKKNQAILLCYIFIYVIIIVKAFWLRS